jgi:hypothetical protein
MVDLPSIVEETYASESNDIGAPLIGLGDLDEFARSAGIEVAAYAQLVSGPLSFGESELG